MRIALVYPGDAEPLLSAMRSEMPEPSSVDNQEWRTLVPATVLVDGIFRVSFPEKVIHHHWVKAIVQDESGAQFAAWVHENGKAYL